MKEPIKDWRNVVIGYIETLGNGDQNGYDRFSRPCGRYDKRLNQTFDRFNWPVSNGNTLSALIVQANNEN